jgi:hypothetical protein
MKATGYLPLEISAFRKFLGNPKASNEDRWQTFGILLAILLEPSDDDIRKLAKSSGITLEDAGKKLRSERVALATKHAFDAYGLYLEYWPRKMEEAEDELLWEVLIKTAHQYKLPPAVNGVKELLREYERRSLARIKERLHLPKRGGSKPQFDSSKLSEHYEQVYTRWKDAKLVFRQNRQRPWRRMVQAAHPDLPEELIERLPHFGPSHLAIEHAARLCGLPAKRAANSFSRSYLIRLVSQQRVKARKG